jgi:glycosyltransferase involved in cell wall biosynthesis
MKVLMLGRIGLLENGGGDKVQIENTALELRKLGVEVEISTGLNFDPFKYDLIHVFQLDWTAETNLYAKKVKKAGKPLILSPIHHSVAEVKKFEDLYAFDFRRLSKFLFKDQHSRDTFKNVYRSFSDPRKILPTIVSVFKGLKRMHQETLKLSDMVLVQTQLEAKDLQATYSVDFNWKIVPNGVGEPFLNPVIAKNPLDIENYILCVGRIEPRKNQLKIIEAVSQLRKELNQDISLVFIGKKVKSRHFEYTHLFNFQLEKNPWIRYIEQIPYEEMPSYYHYAKIGISASWFETTGLTSLEALFCGANAVASGKRAKEYLGDLAQYCVPEDVKSIKEAIKKAYFAPPPAIPEKMRELYTWKNAAVKTLEAYRRFVK